MVNNLFIFYKILFFKGFINYFKEYIYIYFSKGFAVLFISIYLSIINVFIINMYKNFYSIFIYKS